MELWHCHSTRSLRPLWTLEELGMEFELHSLPFPPRFFEPEYLKRNPLGTVPYFVDGDVKMTESSAICQYLVERYQRYDLGLPTDHPEYGAYLNWLHHADTTLTFPQTLTMRYTYLEPSESKREVADDYAKWFIARLRHLDTHLEQNDYLVDKRFTIADIAVTYALYLATILKLDSRFKPQTRAYYDRMTERDAFRRANEHGEPMKLPDVGDN